MKLYEAPNKSFVKIDGIDEVIFFNHIDGMYSLCFDRLGRIGHFSANCEVEVVGQPEDWEDYGQGTVG